MKSALLLTVACCLITAPSIADSPEQYGKALTVTELTRVSDILADPKKYDGKKVRVEGEVVDVCKKRGCWIKLSGDSEEETIVFKVDDGVIVFPMEAKGRKAIAEGVVSARTYSVEELIAQGEHHAEEQGTTFDPSTVKEPKTVVRIMGEGAVLSD
ncbi:MAG: DUF4920 domain-containing protein [Bacteroidetes bacterium]|nr:DUF4920 domain-containing protein [Bacteroidota bacterium]